MTLCHHDAGSLPEKVLREHAITVRLNRLDVTEEIIVAKVHLRPAADGGRFDERPITYHALPVPYSAELNRLLRAYLGLRWLLLEDPPASRERDDAWRYIAEVELEPLYQLGVQTSKNQRRRAQKPRGKINGGPTINQTASELAVKAEYRDLSAKELWPHLHARLYDLELAPEETINPADPTKLAYHYDVDGKQRSISLGGFANIVSAARRNTKSRKPGYH